MSDRAYSIGVWHADAEPALIPAVLESAAAAYGVGAQSGQWFDWKYRRSPFGAPVIAVARDEGGAPQGMVAFGVQQLVLDGRSVCAGVSYDTFVTPGHQGRGLFKKMLATAEEEARSRGIEVLYNFPNPNSRPGFLSASWTDAGGVETWLHPTARAAFSAPRLVASRASGANVNELGEGCAAELDGLVADGYRRLAATTSVVDRSSASDLLRWRIAEPPHRGRYRIIAHDELAAVVRVVSRRGLREVQVLEMLASAAGHSRHPSAMLRSVGRDCRADVVTVLLTAGNPLRRYLRRAAFLPIRNRASFFVKSLTGDERFESRPWSISGLDIHTW